MQNRPKHRAIPSPKKVVAPGWFCRTTSPAAGKGTAAPPVP